MKTLPRLRTAFAVMALIAGSLSAAVLTSSARAGAASGGATIVVQTMDSCKQILGGASYSLTGGGVSMSASTPAGHGGVTGTGCPVPKGTCSAGPCVSFTGVPDGTYRIVTTKTPPANASNPEGYAPCEGGSACRSQVADVSVSGGRVSAVVTNVYPNNKVTTLSFSGTSGDPVVFHDFGLAAPGSNGNAQCDGDSDADDHSTGSPSGSCAFLPESAESSACQPFPWSCTLGNAGSPPPAAHRLGLTLPASVGAFATVPVTVTALNGTATDPAYQGTVTLSSTSDRLAGMPAAYTFTAADAGVHVFSVIMRHPGQQTIAASSRGKSGGSGGTVTFTVANDDASFVEDLYHDVLGRLGSDGEVAYWAGEIGHRGRQGVAAFFSTSTEVDGRNVDAAYQQLIGRTADAGGRSYWVSQLQGGGYDESLLAALASTPAYYGGHGKGTDRGFVTALYQDILGRAPQAAELNGWLAGGPIDRAGVAHSFAFAHEHHLQVVAAAAAGWYQRYLSRPADSGAEYWATQLDHGTRDEVGVASFTSCDEYYGKPVGY
ncbi:MAG TPA: DUF4214 domain-containing protein [Candidatus Dormibacteraeota bacterium]|nr:DUF4214 domain-containing protein [Candidatus Dormibacteraeota bacterium]